MKARDIADKIRYVPVVATNLQPASTGVFYLKYSSLASGEKVLLLQVQD